MHFPADARLAIDPELHLKNDVDRSLLITRPPPLSDRNDLFVLLHPKDAVILSLFDGTRTVRDTGRLWAQMASLAEDAAQTEVSRVVEHFAGLAGSPTGAFVVVDEDREGRIISYDPLDFIIDRGGVNLTDVRLRRPYTVYYLPSLFCPQKCIYCYAKTTPAPEPDLIPLPRIREVFRELNSLGVEAIGLSGGDPLGRKDILDIVSSIVEEGMVPDIPTKVGLGRKRIQQLYDLGLRKLQVSLDSSEPAVIEQMVGLPGSGYHRRLYRLMENLREVGMKIRVNSVLTPINAHTVGDMLDYLGGLGNVFRVILTPYGRSLFCHRDDLFVDPSLLDEVKEVADGKKLIYPYMQIGVAGSAPETFESIEEKRRSWEERAYCTANRQGFIILPDGRVTVCEELYDHPEFIIGDLRTQSVMEVWSSPKALALCQPEQTSVPDGACKTCNAFEECNTQRGRCWRDVIKAYGWSRPHFPDPRCPAAPASPRLT